MRPGRITVTAPSSITGNWQVIEGELASRGIGGACLTVRADEFALPFRAPTPPPTEAACAARATQVFGANGYGYWLGDGTCWIKPATGTCNRSGDAAGAQTPTRWDIGDHVTNPKPLKLPLQVGGSGFPRVTKWRVTACLLERGKTDLTCTWGQPVSIDLRTLPHKPVGAQL